MYKVTYANKYDRSEDARITYPGKLKTLDEAEALAKVLANTGNSIIRILRNNKPIKEKYSPIKRS